MPGFVPTKTAIKSGARMSVRGLRCWYLDGGAYLLGVLRFFDGFVMLDIGPDASANSSECLVSPRRESVATDVGRARGRNVRVVATVVTELCDPW